jgi:hypothetical protein
LQLSMPRKWNSNHWTKGSLHIAEACNLRKAPTILFLRYMNTTVTVLIISHQPYILGLWDNYLPTGPPFNQRDTSCSDLSRQHCSAAYWSQVIKQQLYKMTKTW